MRGHCTATITSLLLLAAWMNPLHAATPRELLDRIKAVGSEGKGNTTAQKAWRELVEIGPPALLPMLKEFDDRRLVVVNWLRPAVDAIVERALRSGQKLPVEELEAFLADRTNPALGRRVAYELLVRVDPTTPDRWLPKMLDDPSAELRREAVARVLTDGEKLVEKHATAAGLVVGMIAKLPASATFVPAKGKEAARAVFKKALTGACDEDQVEACVSQLEVLGDKVDLPRHFGFVRSWALVAPFDNTGMGGFGVAYPPEKGVDLKATYTGKDGKMVSWGGHSSEDPLGLIDLNATLGRHKGAIGYAFTVIDSPVERPIEIRTGSFNATKIFLNGKQVFSHEEYHHGMNIDQYSCRAILKAGKNELLVKVCQNEQTENFAQVWRFQLRLCDSTGVAVPFTVVPPAVPPIGKDK
jgi:hypothetical protein